MAVSLRVIDWLAVPVREAVFVLLQVILCERVAVLLFVDVRVGV